MIQKIIIATMVISLYLLGIAAAEDSHHHSQYAGQEKRVIKSLSPDDIAELEQGKGWGLAKAAELNGMPGPSHLIPMKEKIHLSTEQIIKIEKLYESMKASAIPLGKQLIELEKQLNQSFENQTMTTARLKELLQQIAKTTSQLRFVHLSTHLATPKILTSLQIQQYNRLRGYTGADVCDHPPEGHNMDMWKKHNNCE
ncbi:MAG: hypothetical protein HQM14_20715 [SAR324 cluster bacterium]|nr:hypothetical protein [SAR324 cluster bacterium]